MDCLPIPFVCFQCGTVVGPTIGFASAIVLADARNSGRSQWLNQQRYTLLVYSFLTWRSPVGSSVSCR
ncbi:hypothetical protein E4T52_01837 [Aureobasidium sp. EXF-3400]|nr:hypothetical protein E4T52_01837 [Aureobasidium sp. EXF-3400]